MASQYNRIQELLHQKADLQARLNLLPYDGSPEVKELNGNKYLYIRKRIGSRLTSKYVDAYSDLLYQLLLRNAREARALKKSIRRVEKELAILGFMENELSPGVVLNLDFARAKLKSSIYDQALLEGVATTFSQTEAIIENGKVTGLSASDVQKILNLKHAWEFILDKAVIQFDSNYHILCHIARLVNEGFYDDGGRIRGVPITIGGTVYIPPLPIESVVKESIQEITQSSKDSVDSAIKLCLYCMKAQIFNDGNKRAAVIFANHYLIAQCGGLIVIPEKEVSAFKKLLIAHYESETYPDIIEFMRERCWRRL